MSSGGWDRLVKLCWKQGGSSSIKNERINPGLFVLLRLKKSTFAKVFVQFSMINHWTSEVQVLKQNQWGYITPPPLLGEGHEMNNETSGCLLIEARSIARLTFQRYITKCSSSCLELLSRRELQRSQRDDLPWSLTYGHFVAPSEHPVINFLGECEEMRCCITSPYVICHTKNYLNVLFDYLALLPDLEKTNTLRINSSLKLKLIFYVCGINFIQTEQWAGIHLVIRWYNSHSNAPG